MMRVANVVWIGLVLAGWTGASARADLAVSPDYAREMELLEARSEPACAPSEVRRPGEECRVCDVTSIDRRCGARLQAAGWDRRCSTYDADHAGWGWGPPHEVWCRPLDSHGETPAQDPPRARSTGGSGCAAVPSAAPTLPPLVIVIAAILSLAGRAPRGPK